MMRQPPGYGFSWLVLTTCGALGFFLWGGTTPTLDRVWDLEVALETGRDGGLSETERRLFERTLLQSPSYAAHLSQGKNTVLISAHNRGVLEKPFAYLVRQHAQKNEHLEIALTATDKTVPLRLRVGGVEQDVQVKADSPYRWKLPNDGAFPQLLEIRVKGKKRKKLLRRAALVVRIVGAHD